MRVDSMVEWLVGNVQQHYDKKHRGWQMKDSDTTITYAITYDREFHTLPQTVQEHLQERKERGLLIKEACVQALPLHDNVYMVVGKHGKYKVDIVLGQCTCIDFYQQRSVCKHIFRVLANLNLTIAALPDALTKTAWLTVDAECIYAKRTQTQVQTPTTPEVHFPVAI